MRSRDEGEYQQALAELNRNDTDRDFKEFVVAWGDEIESLMAENEFHLGHCVGRAFSRAEEKIGTRIGSYFMAQMLVFLGTHWEHGDDLMLALTPIERRFAEDAAVLIVDTWQKQAAEEVTDGG